MTRGVGAMAAAGGLWLLLVVGGAACLLTGCGSLGYYAQAVNGHLSLVQRARPVTEWLADERTPSALRERLALSQRLRDFAVQDLQLPDNDSYRRYADLERSAAVWNVVATPELSLTLKTWCFPVVGCVGYRGYYRRESAQALADSLQAQGYEVRVYGVPAYSTLGRTAWLGGDPLLNTFIDGSVPDLARLIFHELAHQVVYVDDDTAFNESFATAVEQFGVQRWLQQHADEATRAVDQRSQQRRQAFRAFVQHWRQALDAVYRSDADAATQRARKAEVLEAMRADHVRRRDTEWGGFRGYDDWVARANNAAFAIQSTYHDGVPAFEAQFQRCGGDFARFYAQVQRLAPLPAAQRWAQLGQAC